MFFSPLYSTACRLFTGCERCLSIATSSRAPRPDEFNHPSFFPKHTQSHLFAVVPNSNFRAPKPNAGKAARFKMQLAACADAGYAARALRICAEMKQAGITPDLTAYNWLLHACAKQGLAHECLALLDDMTALDLHPDLETYNHVLFGQRWNQNFPLEDLLAEMERAGITPNMHTYHHIVLRYVETQNLEMCLRCFAEMNARGLSPTLKTAQIVIELATSLNHPRLALDMAYAFESTSVRKLEAQDWIRILAASTACHFASGVSDAWRKAVDELGITPDEGQCLEVLHTAARHGLSELAMNALQVIVGLEVPLEEFHLAPVLEAFCQRHMLEEAFSTINLMRSSGIQFTQETVFPLTNCIRAHVDQLDEAWAVLERMHQQGKPIDVTSMNAIIQAAAYLNDLQRAIGTYKAFPDFSVKPTISTFNVLLSGCISARHRELGDKLLAELRELSLVPDSQTFERMIILCLTQTTYEDAFFYLEEMKGQGYMPPLSVYTALVRKCVVSGDVRWKIALDEMKDCGYDVSPALQRFIETGGKVSGRAWQQSAHTKHRDLDGPSAPPSSDHTR